MTDFYVCFFGSGKRMRGRRWWRGRSFAVSALHSSFIVTCFVVENTYVF
jgi:hypothetical protein